nr:hypothetical protein [uncultured Desulfobulbus sp.]
MFPDEFWVQLTQDEIFTCPFCTGSVQYREGQRTGQCMECMSLFHEYVGTLRFSTKGPPHFDMMKVWAEKGDLVIWIEKTEENRRVLSDVFLKPKDGDQRG